MAPHCHVLLVDDDPTIRLTVGDALREDGFDVAIAQDGMQAVTLLAERRYDVMITDVRMPKLGGLALFYRARELQPDISVFLITAFGDVDDAVAALKSGAVDYLTKPFSIDELVLRVRRLSERLALRHELLEARAALADEGLGARLIGRGSAMRRLHERISTMAAADAPVVISGESGTGKGLIARALHDAGPRRDKPFVSVSCAAFPEALIEAELFGHERGAFTGATAKREGRFKAADGGTLFLDEIGEIPLSVQVKLLRALQDGVVEPLGSNDSVSVDVRIVCATHRNLKRMVAEETFREDLYYRLNVLQIQVPPLRERRGDLPMLVGHFYRRFSKTDGEPQLSPPAWEALNRHSFPGNVRELEHAIHHAVVLARGREIDVQDLPTDIVGLDGYVSETRETRGPRQLAESMKEFERHCLIGALNDSNGVKKLAAENLGISRKTLWEKLKAHGIDDSDIDG